MIFYPIYKRYHANYRCIRLNYSPFMPQFTLSISLFQDRESNSEFSLTRLSATSIESEIHLVRNKICQTES